METAVRSAAQEKEDPPAAQNENAALPEGGAAFRSAENFYAKRFWNSVTMSSALSITTSITLLPTETTRELFSH